MHLFFPLLPPSPSTSLRSIAICLPTHPLCLPPFIPPAQDLTYTYPFLVTWINALRVLSCRRFTVLHLVIMFVPITYFINKTVVYVATAFPFLQFSLQDFIAFFLWILFCLLYFLVIVFCLFVYLFIIKMPLIFTRIRFSCTYYFCICLVMFIYYFIIFFELLHFFIFIFFIINSLPWKS